MAQHRYLVEFEEAPRDLALFAKELDACIQAGNEDYATHRKYGMHAPAVESLRPGVYMEWMRRSGKIGATVRGRRWRSRSRTR